MSERNSAARAVIPRDKLAASRTSHTENRVLAPGTNLYGLRPVPIVDDGSVAANGADMQNPFNIQQWSSATEQQVRAAGRRVGGSRKWSESICVWDCAFGAR